MFCSGWIRTLVTMATYTCSSHRLILGKVEIDSLTLSQWGYFDFFTEMFIDVSSTSYKTFVQIA